MPSHEDPNAPTLLYCRSTNQGRIVTNLEASSVSELDGPFRIGMTLEGRYRLHRVLGRGAMGQVFLAEDIRLARYAAIKVVQHQRHGDDLEAALEREAKLGANLGHQGIATVYDFGFHENKSFTVFEFVEGESLRQLLHQRGKFPLSEASTIIGDLAAALDFAHIKGVVHRDLKPENIFWTPAGQFKILDFGIAHDITTEITQGIYSGTPAYSSPEQSRCHPTDGRSDQYALALIAYEMLTGQRPFSHSDPSRLLKMHIEDTPQRPTEHEPDLPEATEQAILRALSKNPEDRFGSCQEFARYFSTARTTSPPRQLMPISSHNRIGVYIAHVAEESLLSRQIGQGLEQFKISTWYYGRDALPGVPLTAQSREAIERSQAIVVLISRASINSIDFERDLEHAYRVRCPLLPLLISMTREEFEKVKPTWHKMLGDLTCLEHQAGRPVSELLRRLADAANYLGVEPNPSLVPSNEPQPSICSGPIWATDANQIDIHDLQRVVFRNELVNDFLMKRNRYFISASKGYGKTLLLTYKRLLISAETNQQLILIPEGSPFLDFMSEMRSLSYRFEQPLSDLTTTKRLWSMAFRISAISHHPHLVDDSEAIELLLLPDRIRRWLTGKKIQPTVVFKELTMLRVSELNRLIDQTENFLDLKTRRIHSGTYFFIDKVDQAIHHLGRDAWISIQAGLIEAAWELMNANSHLKVFASIRQEAFTNYQSDTKSNLYSATSTINYTNDELNELLDNLALCYEGTKSFSEFLGHNVIRHGRRSIPEDSFRYVRRHTFGRPRDLVAIASEVSSKRSTLNEKRLREIVQHTGSTVLVANLFDEVRVFLTCLDHQQERLRFFGTLVSNILEKQEAIRSCEIFNGLEPGSLRHFGEDSNQIFHPFRDLYISGLLGVVECDPEYGVSSQRFRKPHDPLIHSATQVPNSPVYLIHPALDTFIRGQYPNLSFLQYQHIPIGENLPWEPHFLKVMQVEKLMHGMDELRFVKLVHQVLARIQSFHSSGSHQFAQLEIETSPEWKELNTSQNDDACTEILLWLEEMIAEL